MTTPLEPPHEPASLRLPPPRTGSTPGGSSGSDAAGPRSGRSAGRPWWKILLGVLAILVLGISGCTIWFIRTVSAPVGVANDFLGAVNADDFAAAEGYIGTCSGGMTAADLEDMRGRELTYNLTRSNISSGTGDTSQAQVSGTFMLDGVPGPDIRLTLAKEDGDWRVCGLSSGDFSNDG